MTSRRGFLRGLLVGAAALAMPKIVLETLEEKEGLQSGEALRYQADRWEPSVVYTPFRYELTESQIEALNGLYRDALARGFS